MLQLDLSSRPRLRPAGGPGAIRSALGAMVLAAAAFAEPVGAAPKPVVLLAGQPGLAAGGDVHVAAGEGHVLVTRALAAGGSELLDIRAGQPPRTIRTFEGGATTPSVGTDSTGRPVAILRPCAPNPRDTRAGAKPRRCAFVIVDVESGRQRKLTASDDAYAADLDRGDVLLVRASARDVARVVVRPSNHGLDPTSYSLGQVMKANAKRFKDASPSVVAADLRRGVVALTVEGYDGTTSASLLLMHRPGASAWTQLGVSAWGGAALSPRRWTAPTVTPTGVRAYFDGGEEAPRQAVRWSLAGKKLRVVSASRFGGPTRTDRVAFDGDSIVSVADDCDDQDPCDVLSAGPVGLG